MSCPHTPWHTRRAHAATYPVGVVYFSSSRVTDERRNDDDVEDELLPMLLAPVQALFVRVVQ